MAPTKKNVLITGCSADGLGAVLAEALHKTNRYRVIATARTPSKMQNLAAQGIETLPLDVLSAESIASCVTAAQKLLAVDDEPGVLHMLILNAGGGYAAPMLDTELDHMREVFDLNVFSQVAVMKAFFPLLLAARERDGPNAATLVLQTSLSSVMAMPLQGVYSATKAALSAMADSLRLELKPFDINVVELKTGAVRTHFFGNMTGAPKLPADSIYNMGKATAAIEEKMARQMDPKDMMDSTKWGAQVVSALDAHRPPAQIWKGTSTLVVWIMRTFAWHTAGDSILMSMGAMDLVKSEWRKLRGGQA